MVGLIGFLSLCVAVSVTWIMLLSQYLIKNGGISGAMEGSVTNFLIVLIGLFLPLIVIANALAFVYVAMEMKKNQLIFKDWVSSLKKEWVSHEESIHMLIGDQLQEELDRDTQTLPLPFEEKTVMNILKNEPISKYKDLELPDDVDLRFVDKK